MQPPRGPQKPRSEKRSEYTATGGCSHAEPLQAALMSFGHQLKAGKESDGHVSPRGAESTGLCLPDPLEEDRHLQVHRPGNLHGVTGTGLPEEIRVLFRRKDLYLLAAERKKEEKRKLSTTRLCVCLFII